MKIIKDEARINNSMRWLVKLVKFNKLMPLHYQKVRRSNIIRMERERDESVARRSAPEISVHVVRGIQGD